MEMMNTGDSCSPTPDHEQQPLSRVLPPLQRDMNAREQQVAPGLQAAALSWPVWCKPLLSKAFPVCEEKAAEDDQNDLNLLNGPK
ncbi:hypothetical protein AAY473_026729 [Plecturocebus cupreus]